MLQLPEQLADCDLEAVCYDFQIQQADVSLAAFHIGKVAAVKAEHVGHLSLSPSAPLAQMAQTFTEGNSDVRAGHPLIIGRRLSATNRL